MDQVAEFQEAMMFYRKACIEWGEAKTIDNHDRAIAAQVEVLSLYRAALAFQPEEQAEPLKLPPRKIPPHSPAPRSWNDIFADGEAIGWNRCLDAIAAIAPQPDRSEEQAAASINDEATDRMLDAADARKGKARG